MNFSLYRSAAFTPLRKQDTFAPEISVRPATSAMKRRKRCAAMLCAALVALSTQAGDWPQWGGTQARNMYSPATGLPDHFTTGKEGDIKFKPGTEQVDRSNVQNLKWV